MSNFHRDPIMDNQMLSPKNLVRAKPLTQFDIIREAYIKAGIKHTIVEWLGYKYLIVGSANEHQFILDKSKYSYLTFNKFGQLRTV